MRYVLGRGLQGLTQSEVIEFLQGRVSALGIGPKHYTYLIELTDRTYPQMLNHIKKCLVV